MKLKILYLITALIFITALVFSLIILQPSKAKNVEIISGEKILYTIDLSAAENQTIKISCEDGYNLIEILDGEIYVKESDCPDKTCVKMGRLDSGAPVVCLPHRLVIRFTDGGEVDAVAR